MFSSEKSERFRQFVQMKKLFKVTEINAFNSKRGEIIWTVFFCWIKWTKIKRKKIVKEKKMSATVLYLSPESPKPWEYINNYNSKGIEPSNHPFIFAPRDTCSLFVCNCKNDSTIIITVLNGEVMQETRVQPNVFN